MQEHIERLRSESFEAATEQNSFVELAELECWSALEEILQFNPDLSVTENKSRQLTLLLLSIEFRMPTDFIQAPLLTLVSKTQMSYDEVETSVLEKLRLSRSWKLESDLLHAVYESFAEHQSQVKSLERVCFLLEKNGYAGIDLPKYYESLLRLSPSSKQALNFFKVFFLQEKRYKEAKAVSERLIGSLGSPVAKATEIHDLCGILLHKLNEPEQALEVLESIPKTAGLDSSGLRFDCFVSLGSYDEAEEILLDAISAVPESEPGQKLLLRRRLLGLYELSKREKDALVVAEHLMEEESLEMKALEYLVSHSLEGKKWPRVDFLLQSLKKSLGTDRKKRQIEITLKRLQDSLV